MLYFNNICEHKIMTTLGALTPTFEKQSLAAIIIEKIEDKELHCSTNGYDARDNYLSELKKKLIELDNAKIDHFQTLLAMLVDLACNKKTEAIEASQIAVTILDEVFNVKCEAILVEQAQPKQRKSFSIGNLVCGELKTLSNVSNRTLKFVELKRSRGQLVESCNSLENSGVIPMQMSKENTDDLTFPLLFQSMAAPGDWQAHDVNIQEPTIKKCRNQPN